MMGETQKHIESAIKTFSMDLKQSKGKTTLPGKMDSLLETILQQVQQSRQIKKELKDTVAQEFSTGNRVKVMNILEHLLNELKTKSMMGETQKHIESAIKTFSMDLKQSKGKTTLPGKMDSLLETILQQVQQSRQIKKELKDTVAQEFSTGNR